MRLSITTCSYIKRLDGSRVPISQSIDLLAKAGFNCIDVFFGDATSKESELSRKDWALWAEELRMDLDKRGISVTQAHAPFYNALSPDINDHASRGEAIRRSIIAADILGANWIVMHPCTNYLSNYLDVNIKGNIEFFSPFIELAEKQPNGIGVAIENLFDTQHQIVSATASTETADNRFSNGIITKRRFGSSVWELKLLLQELQKNFKKVGICWDFGHANLTGMNQVDALRIIGKDLKAVHVHDNSGLHDEHMLPLLGTVPWSDILPILKEIDYQGDFTYEAHTITKRMPESLVLESLNYAHKIGDFLLSL